MCILPPSLLSISGSYNRKYLMLDKCLHVAPIPMVLHEFTYHVAQPIPELWLHANALCIQISKYWSLNCAKV